MNFCHNYEFCEWQRMYRIINNWFIITLFKSVFICVNLWFNFFVSIYSYPSPFLSHKEAVPKPIFVIASTRRVRGNLRTFNTLWDCFVASLLAMTQKEGFWHKLTRGEGFRKDKSSVVSLLLNIFSCLLLTFVRMTLRVACFRGKIFFSVFSVV